MSLSGERIWQRVQGLLPAEISGNPSLCVGFSGGLDSVVLLHLLSSVQQTHNKPFQLKAIHVNHQMQSDAESWANFCQQFCSSRKISFHAIKVDVLSSNKTGVEAAARKARYAAFTQNLSADEVLLTAHHLDDQIETVFLQLLRGTGIQGAAAIHPCSKITDLYLIRPLLGFDRKYLLNYAEQRQLSWVDDPSNVETRFNRNYIRHEVLPIIEKRWPAYRKTIERFANNARSASQVLNDYISQDYQICFNVDKKTLKIDLLIKLGLEKCLLVIRFWLNQLNFSTPSDAILLQIYSLQTAKDDANPLIEWGDALVRRYRNEIFVMSRSKFNAQQTMFNKSIFRLGFWWEPNNKIVVDDFGVLVSEKTFGQGLKVEFLQTKIQIVFRQGGENCQPVGRQGTHSLKKLFQEFAVPPWLRNQVPIIMIDNQIAGVVGFFYCSPFAAEKNEQSFIVTLVPID